MWAREREGFSNYSRWAGEENMSRTSLCCNLTPEQPLPAAPCMNNQRRSCYSSWFGWHIRPWAIDIFQWINVTRSGERRGCISLMWLKHNYPCILSPFLFIFFLSLIQLLMPSQLGSWKSLCANFTKRLSAHGMWRARYIDMVWAENKYRQAGGASYAADAVLHGKKKKRGLLARREVG